MKVKLQSILKILIFLGIGFFLLWLVAKDIKEEDRVNIKLAFHRADYIWILISMLLGLLSHISRAVRWKLLLAPLDHNPKLYNTFFAVMIGYLANFALPRLGEVSRCGILSKYEKIPFSESFGTVIAERAIDLLCLILLFFLTLFLQFTEINGLINERIIHPIYNSMSEFLTNTFFLLFLVCFTAIIFFILMKYRKKIQNLFSDRITKLLLGFWEGIKTIKKIKKPGLFLMHSLFIWTMYYLMLHVCFFSFQETSDLGVGEALAVMIFGSIGIIFVPGGTGAYQALVTEVLTVAYAVSFSVAFAFSWIVWTAQLISIVSLGIISILLLPLFNKGNRPGEKVHRKEKVPCVDTLKITNGKA